MNRILVVVASAFLLGAVSGSSAEDYPTRSIQIFVGTSPGGAVDAMARALADDMGKILGGTLVVANKPGHNGVLAAAQVVRSTPDGYSLGFHAAGAFVSDPYLPQGVPYRLDQVDFLCQVFELQVALAVPRNSPFKSVGDYIHAARLNPGKISVGTVGPGSIPGMTVKLLEKAAGIRLNQIPYKGDADNVTALLGNQIDSAVPGLSTVIHKGPPILGIFGAKRLVSHPNIPTFKELGYPVVKVGMVGLYAPTGLPAQVRTKLISACHATAESGARIHALSQKLGQDISYLDSAEWRKRIIADGKQNKVMLEQLSRSSK